MCVCVCVCVCACVCLVHVCECVWVDRMRGMCDGKKGKRTTRESAIDEWLWLAQKGVAGRTGLCFKNGREMKREGEMKRGREKK